MLLRAPAECANAQLKSWRILRKLPAALARRAADQGDPGPSNLRNRTMKGSISVFILIVQESGGWADQVRRVALGHSEAPGR
jgi:hypothetical protein